MGVKASAVLIRGLARTFEEYATALEAEQDDAAARPEEPAETEDAVELVKGSRQKMVLTLDHLHTEEGMRTKDIAGAIDYDEPNTWLVLDALRSRGLVEEIPDMEPQRWRLTRKYRGTAAPYLAVARFIRPSEWTTYADVAIAGGGGPTAARAVARAAATLPHFPNPHRVLAKGGVVPDGWKDDQGRGPEECRRRLEAEGINFIDDHAGPAHRVAWDTLKERADAAASA